MNKKPLILLAIVLLLIVASLIVYAYTKTSQSPTPPPETPIATPPISVEKPTDEERKLEIEEMKRKINDIDNKSFQIKEASENEEECDEETTEAQESYAEEVVTGKARSSEGIVLEKNNYNLKIEFYQGSYQWISEVQTDNTTDISFISLKPGGETTKASLSEIEIGDRVIVKVIKGDKVIDESFKAEMIYIYN